MEEENNKKDLQDDKELNELSKLYAAAVSIDYRKIIDGFFEHFMWIGLIILTQLLYRHEEEPHSILKTVEAVVPIIGLLLSVIHNLIRCHRVKKHFFTSITELTKIFISVAKKCVPPTEQYLFMFLCAITAAFLIYGIYAAIIIQGNTVVVLSVAYLPFFVYYAKDRIVNRVINISESE